MSFGTLVGVIDEGTSSARFMIFKADSDEIVCFHQLGVPSIYPHEGWCEQDPIVILDTVLKCIDNAVKKLEKLGGSYEDIVAVGITNQRESTVVWDRETGVPLYNAIIWLDMRTSPTVEKLLIENNARDKNCLQSLCGLPLSPYFSALKLRWLIDYVPSVRQAIKDNICLFGTIDSWLIWNLTGGIDHGLHITDVTNASRTMLMNIATMTWDPKLLKFFGIPKEILPEIRSSSEIYGKIKLNCLPDCPISGCLGDQHAALVGQQCFQIGEAKCTYGTGCFLLYNTGKSAFYSTNGLLTTVAYQIGNEAPVYALEGSVAIAGAAFAWLQDNLNLVSDLTQIEDAAKTVNDCGDVYFVPAFSGLYAPYWDQEARGTIVGLSQQTKKEHIIRATIEAICFQVRDILEAMKKDCGYPLTNLKVDGGVTTNKLLLQSQADLIGIDCILPKQAETTSLGAAMVAYRAITGAKNMKLNLSPKSYKIFKSVITNEEREFRYSKWKEAIQRSLRWDT